MGAGAPAFWFIDIFLDGETLRHCNAERAITFDGQTYAALGDRLTPPGDIDRAANLKAQKFSLRYDSSQQTINTDVVGKILDAQWKRRKIRVRYAVGGVNASGYDFTAPFIIADEAGRIKNLSDSIAAGEAPTLELEIESGALIFLERRNQMRSPANQKAAFPGDLFFDLAARLDGVVLPWRTKKSKNGNVQIEYEVDGVSPRQLLIGRGHTRGSFVFGATGGQQRKFWNQVYALADHQCEALEKMYVNGVNALSDPAPLEHGVKKALELLNSGGTRLWVTWYDGRDDQVADAYLIALTASQPLKWTSAHRGRGVSYVIIEHAWDSDNPESFSYEFQLRGARVYQEQKDTTAGGSGSHRLANPATWEFTTNPEEALRHYLRGRVVSSSSSYSWFGVGAATDFLDAYEKYKYRADHCDDLVPLQAGGTQKRYEANGFLSAADSHAKNIEKLCDAMVADPVDEGGRVSIRLSEPQTPVIALYDTDLVDDEETNAEVNARGDDVINRVEGRFQDPNNKYASIDYPPISNSAYETIDGDEVEGTWNQVLETSEERAQRKATLYLNKQRRTLELEENFGTKAKDVRPGDWITRHSALRGFPSGKVFIADEVRRFVDGTVRLLLLEVDPAELVWDAADAQLTVIGDGPTTIDRQSLDVPDVNVTAISVSGGSVTIPAVRFAVATYDSFMGDEIECEFGIWNGVSGVGAAIAGPSEVLKIPGNFVTFDGLKGLLPGTGYAFRFRARDGERYSAFSTFRTLTTSGTYQAGRSAIADSIVGQGPGATAAAGDVLNAFTATGVNQLVDHAFRFPATFWRATAQSGSVSAATNETLGIRRRTLTGAGVTVGHYLQLDSFPDRTRFACKAGDVVEASAFVAAANVSTVSVFINWYNASNASVGFSSLPTVSPGSATASINDFSRVAVIATAPANTAFAFINVRATATTSAPVLHVARPMLALANASQTAPTAWNPGFDATPGADPTAANTAAAITGQGAFATVNTAGYGSALLTGFGGLSPLNFTTLGAGGLVRRQDGVTALTDAAAVTSLGTAAAIAGQGAFATLSAINDSLANSNNLLRRSAGGLFTGNLAATLGARAGTDIFRTDGATILTQAEIRTPEGTAAAITGQGVFATGNYYEQTSDPASVPNGSFLFRTDTNELKIRRSGSWAIVATLSAAAPSVPTITGAAVYTGLSGTNRTTNAVGVNLNGVPTPSSYIWTCSNPNVVLTAPNGAACAFRIPSLGTDTTAAIQCTIETSQGFFTIVGAARWILTN